MGGQARLTTHTIVGPGHHITVGSSKYLPALGWNAWNSGGVLKLAGDRFEEDEAEILDLLAKIHH
jgi:hypothetical protein